MSAPNVPFCRALHSGVRGGDVKAHKIAIHRADPKAYTVTKYTDYFGEYFENAVVKFQKRHGIQATGRIGRVTHEELERTHNAGSKTTWAFNDAAIHLAKTFCNEYTKTPDELRREAIVNAGYYWYGHRGQIGYSQSRPMQLGRPPWVPSRWDCSAFVTNCHYAGHAPDPNDRGYDHLGYTGTLLSTGRKVSHVTDLRIGDLVFYGFTTHASPAFPLGSPTHVALYVGKVNGVHSVLSMGSYPMRLLRFDYRSVNQFRHYNVTPGI
jgi:Putative peptidoglycan binding domain